MEFKVNREEITSAEVIFDDVQEQSVELDYVLPDYYPEIFKILKCITNPVIMSYSVNGDKLTYEMTVCIRVLYCTEHSNAVQCIDQKLVYTKSVDLGRTVVNPKICILPKTDYINCRAVNQRRLDIRGAVSVKIKISDLKKEEVISDAFGGNIQLKKQSVTYPSNKLYAVKRINVSENFDLGLSKPSIVNVLRSDAVIASNDKKIIANKLIAKGEVYINMLYSCLKDGIDGIEAMQFTIPFSQIIDMEGIDDRYNSFIEAEIISCDIEPRSDGDGNSKIAECNLTIMLTCSAYRIYSAELAIDEYSTAYRTDSVKSDVKIELPPQYINSSCVIKSSLETSDGEIDCIYDAWCTISNVTARPDPENTQIIVNGTASYNVIARSSEGIPIMLEKEDSFTTNVQAENITEMTIANIKLVPVSCSYNLASDNNVEVKSEVKIIGIAENTMELKGITELVIDENEPIKRGNNYALKLYFTDENEDLWEIAKKYNTSVSAIMEENDIEDDMISSSGMILIPIV